MESLEKRGMVEEQVRDCGQVQVALGGSLQVGPIRMTAGLWRGEDQWQKGLSVVFMVHTHTIHKVGLEEEELVSMGPVVVVDIPEEEEEVLAPHMTGKPGQPVVVVVLLVRP